MRRYALEFLRMPAQPAPDAQQNSARAGEYRRGGQLYAPHAAGRLKSQHSIAPQFQKGELGDYNGGSPENHAASVHYAVLLMLSECVQRLDSAPVATRS